MRSLLDLPRPLVLDADGINAVSGTMGLLSVRRGRVTVLTPHEGEFLRAGGDLTPGREEAARRFARLHGVYLILKGHRDGHRRAGRALRRESDGKRRDGQGRQRRRALRDGAEPARTGDGAVCGVLRGGVSARRAGDLAARELGERGMTPSDLLERIPRAFLSL